MTKSEIAYNLSRKYPDLPNEVISKIIELILSEITKTLSSKGRVEIRGFGSFSLRKRPSRMARNPKTDKVTLVPERYAVYFRYGKDFFDLLNN